MIEVRKVGQTLHPHKVILKGQRKTPAEHHVNQYVTIKGINAVVAFLSALLSIYLFLGINSISGVGYKILLIAGSAVFLGISVCILSSSEKITNNNFLKKKIKR